jgi:hypothetical protein
MTALPQEQLVFWDENGYLVMEEVISGGEVEESRAALDRLTAHAAGLLNHLRAGRFTEIVEGDTSAFDAREVALPVKAGGLPSGIA